MGSRRNIPNCLSAIFEFPVGARSNNCSAARIPNYGEIRELISVAAARATQKRIDSFVTNEVASDQETAIRVVHQVCALRPRPPAIKGALSPVTHDDEIGIDFSGELSNFFRGLPSHKLGDWIEAKLSQATNTLIEYFLESFLYLDRCPCQSHFGKQK
jgi:hypothetical protein